MRDLVKTWLPEGASTTIRTLKDRNGGDQTGSFHRYLVIICPDGWSESVNARLLQEGLAFIDACSASEREAVEATFLSGDTD